MSPFDDSLPSENKADAGKNKGARTEINSAQKPAKTKIGKVVKIRSFDLNEACKIHGCDVNALDCAVNVCRANEGAYVYNLCLRDLSVNYRDPDKAAPQRSEKR